MNILLAPSDMAATPSLHTWFLDDHELSLFQNQGKLTYEARQLKTGDRWEGTLPSNPMLPTIDNLIQYYLNCAPQFPGIQRVTFKPNPKPLHEWNYDSNNVKLINQEGTLFWEISDPIRKVTSRILLDSVYIFNKGRIEYHEKFFQPPVHYYDWNADFDPKAEDYVPLFIYMHQRITFDQKISYFTDCVIEKIEVEDRRPCHLFIKKVLKQSKLEPQIIIDSHYWAVTPINTGESDRSNTRSWGGHAAIAIEVLNEGNYFMHKAHLTDKGVKFEKAISTLNLTGRGKTWLRERALVQRMIDKIIWECFLQQNGVDRPRFHLGGRDAVSSPIKVIGELKEGEDKANLGELAELSQIEIRDRKVFLVADNCISWTRTIVKIANINLPPGILKWIVTIPKEYMEEVYPKRITLHI